MRRYTTDSRCGPRASSASRRTRRAAPGTRQQIDGDLGKRGEPHLFLDPSALEHDAVIGICKEHIGEIER
jgi:hypothetical protein